VDGESEEAGRLRGVQSKIVTRAISLC
jgi:hypothetical protein